MFAGWQTFFQTTAEAAATLTGLVFVVVTLSAGRQTTAANSNGARLFTSPTVFHLTSVLVISALALMPCGQLPILAEAVTVMMGLWALGFLIYAGVVLNDILHLESQTHWSDRWCYGVAPTLAYAWLTGGAVAACLRMTYAPHAVALGLIGLLLICIRNAWDLATWLAPRRETPPEG
jgi:hypothetical protein